MCSSIRCNSSFLEEVMVGNKDDQSWCSDEHWYVQERQLVLSLCLDKLQCSQMPNLHRSVLLANTMRHIQREIALEKDPISNLRSTHISNTQVDTPLCPPDSIFQPPNCTPMLSDINQGAMDVEMDVSFFPSTFAASSSAPFRDAVFTESSLIGIMSVVEAGNSLGCDLAIDDIFEDIDTSMYDSSDMSSVMTCVFCSVSQLFSGEEEVIMLQDCPCVSPLQCSSTDVSDLDNIMEVLVGLV